MVHFEAVRQVVNSCTTFIGMGDYDDLVATVNELSGELVDVALNSSWLGEEEVADHGNVVWHFGDSGRLRPVEQQSHNAFSWRANYKAMHDP